MKVFRDIGVRARLMMLIAAAMLPLIGLIVIGLVESYRDAEAEARWRVANEAKLGADRISDTFGRAREFLATLRHMPEIADASQPACDAMLAGLKAERPQFHTLGVMAPDGTILCHSKGTKGSTFGDRRLTQRVVAARGPQFVVGDFMIGPISKKPTVAVAMRLPPRADGKPAGAVFASLNLSLIEAEIQRMAGESGHSVMIVQPRTSRVLVNWPHVADFGTALPERPLFAEMLRQFDGGTATLDDLSDERRFFGFEPIEDARTAGLSLAIGVPLEEVFATVRNRTRWAMIMGAIALLVALGSAALLGYWMQLRPIEQLSLAARRIGAGEFRTRTGMDRWQAPEFRRLGRLVDGAAETLAKAQAAELEIAASERRFRLVADNTADMISCIDADGLRTLVTGASSKLLGYFPRELLGQSPVAIVVPEDHPIVTAALAEARAGRSVSGVRYRVRRKDGAIIWVEISGQPIADGSGFVISMRDVDARQRMEVQLEEANRLLEEQASTDELTRLANRRTFNRSLAQSFAASAQTNGDIALLLIDVDRFKAYNDRYGHPAGDKCLAAIAGAIESCLKGGDEIGARYGGEELAMILPGSGMTEALARAEALRRAILALAIEHLGNEGGRVSVSIGVASRRGLGTLTDSAELLQRADEALYEAKAGGRNQVRSRAA